MRSSSYALPESEPEVTFEILSVNIYFAGALFSSLLAQSYKGDFSEKQASLPAYSLLA